MRIYLDGALFHQNSGKTKTFSNVNGDIRKIGSMGGKLSSCLHI